MCGRFTMTHEQLELLAEDLGVPVESLPNIRPRYNIAPTDEHFIVRMEHEDREAVPAKWGLLNWWSKDAKRAALQINARAETLEQKTPFKEAFLKHRCIVPADGFFEWTGPKEDRRPIWFHSPDGSLLYFAGLYDYWRPNPDEWQRTFTIVTTTANDLIAPVHDRMPVILSRDDIDDWISPGVDLNRARSLLVPAPVGVLSARRVSQKVNSVKNDTPDILTEQPGLLLPGI
jgi:putative SOS response-associated peptidase YedK